MKSLDVLERALERRKGSLKRENTKFTVQKSASDIEEDTQSTLGVFPDTEGKRTDNADNGAENIESVMDVLAMARRYFPAPEDPVIPPALPGRDPMVKRGTDKSEFFMGNWRGAWPRDFEAYKGGVV